MSYHKQLECPTCNNIADSEVFITHGCKIPTMIIFGCRHYTMSNEVIKKVLGIESSYPLDHPEEKLMDEEIQLSEDDSLFNHN